MRAPPRTVGQSWGRYPPAVHTRVVPLVWRSDPLPLAGVSERLLPFAWGRSYGDSCLNHGEAILDVAGLDRFIEFDDAVGRLRCEAGVTLADILAVVTPRGWFLPVVPGTKWVSVGGAIANDIHGKNHHRAGTFGAHVVCFELLRSTGERLLCSPDSNPDLFRATIGGLGLTGVIVWAEIRLLRVAGAGMSVERARYPDLATFFDLSASDADYEYTVAWVDCLARGRRLGRGVYLRGDHAPAAGGGSGFRGRPGLRIPFDAPSRLLNRITVGAFNTLYYLRHPRVARRTALGYEEFFFPLDGVEAWNRMYGRPGFLQYQCVVPGDDPRAGALRAILDRVSYSRETPGLAVLKRFGSVPSPGMLSFPRPGLTLAVDLAFRGRSTLDLLDALDAIVRAAGGAVYPAKDARMSGESFRSFFPAWQSFARYVDPKFSSSFWRRVTAG
jgi:FAD/FMN-containing dehydrogenase